MSAAAETRAAAASASIAPSAVLGVRNVLTTSGTLQRPARPPSRARHGSGALVGGRTQRNQAAGLPYRAECIGGADLRTDPEQDVRLVQQQRSADHYAEVAVTGDAAQCPYTMGQPL